VFIFLKVTTARAIRFIPVKAKQVYLKMLRSHRRQEDKKSHLQAVGSKGIILPFGHLKLLTLYSSFITVRSELKVMLENFQKLGQPSMFTEPNRAPLSGNEILHDTTILNSVRDGCSASSSVCTIQFFIKTRTFLSNREVFRSSFVIEIGVNHAHN
jgi:hypothetical protein